MNAKIKNFVNLLLMNTVALSLQSFPLRVEATEQNQTFKQTCELSFFKRTPITQDTIQTSSQIAKLKEPSTPGGYLFAMLISENRSPTEKEFANAVSYYQSRMLLQKFWRWRSQSQMGITVPPDERDFNRSLKALRRLKQDLLKPIIDTHDQTTRFHHAVKIIIALLEQQIVVDSTITTPLVVVADIVSRNASLNRSTAQTVQLKKLAAIALFDLALLSAARGNPVETDELRFRPLLEAATLVPSLPGQLFVELRMFENFDLYLNAYRNYLNQDEVLRFARRSALGNRDPVMLVQWLPYKFGLTTTSPSTDFRKAIWSRQSEMPPSDLVASEIAQILGISPDSN